MKQEHDTILERFSSISGEEFLDLLKKCFPEQVKQDLESSYPVTASAFALLSSSEVLEIEYQVLHQIGQTCFDSLMGFKASNQPHYRREILRYGCTVASDVLMRRTRMTAHNPPPEIHSMMRADIFAGDLYSGDMIAAAVERAGLSFRPGKKYLDFGCSSGALVRNMAAALPEANWYGCDPVPASVEWAKSSFPNIKFRVNSQDPPLPYDNQFFDGVYAVSIWSHFSERAALLWFAEMVRVLQPGGFLVLTTHGLRSVYYYLERGFYDLRESSIQLARLLRDGFAFQVTFDENHPDYGLAVSDWGNAYFMPNWLARHSGSWRVADYAPGLNQSNQDVWVLIRK